MTLPDLIPYIDKDVRVYLFDGRIIEGKLSFIPARNTRFVKNEFCFTLGKIKFGPLGVWKIEEVEK